MKHTYTLRFLLALLLAMQLPSQVRAQGIGVGTTAPDASAALDIVASNKGALLPRITESARTGMGSPAPGLIVYQTNGSKPGFWYNAGTAAVPNWVRLTDSNGVSYDPVTGLQVGPGPVTTSTGPFTVGTATGSLNVPFNGSTAVRTEQIYTAAELTAAGVHAGPLTSITFIVSTKASTTPFTNFTVSLGNTVAASTTTTFSTGLTPVFVGNVSTTTGDNVLPLTSPFTWDGTSNLAVQTCYTNASTGNDDYSSYFADASNQLLYAFGPCTSSSGAQFAGRYVLRFSQPGSGYSLPPSAGATGQVLTMQVDGTAQWSDPAWYRNGIHAYRPYGPGTVAIGSTSTRTRLSITPSTTEAKITLWDGGSTANHYGFGVSSTQLNYHVDVPNSSHVFYVGGKNGPEPGVSTELMRIRGNGRVGIGLSNPQQQLHVYSTGPATKIRIQNSNTSGGYGPAALEFWSDPPGSGGEWRPGMIRSTDQATGTYTGGLAFYVNGSGFANRQDSIEVMRLTQNRVGIGTSSPSSRLEILNDGGGSGAVDDVVLRSYGTNVAPGLTMRTAHGTAAAPTNMAYNDFIGEIGFTPFSGGAFPAFTTTGLQAYYKGHGSSAASEMYFKTSNAFQAVLDSAGRLGLGLYTPAYRLDVNGTIRAITGQGIILDAQNRPLITRGWDTFTSGNYTGLGRWGLFMEPNILTFGVPTMANRHFQWVTYNANSNIDNTLMMLTQSGTLGVGTGNPTSRVEIVNDNDSGTLGGGADDMVIRSYESAGAASPGLALQFARGTAAAPQNMATGDVMGVIGMSGRINGITGSGFALSGIRGTYQGSGTTVLTDLNFFTSGADRLRIDENGQVGIGLANPSHRLEVVATGALERGVSAENTYIGNTDTRAVFGRAVNNPGYGYGGYFEGGYTGVRAEAQSTSYNFSSYAVSAQAFGTAGSHYALYGNASGGSNSYGLWATATGASINNYAGYFQGNVHVNGTLSKSAGTFRIDHPQDPENKYLVHSFVESPDMMNVYNGNVTTDAQGNATVTLPAYFEAENKDFKYQLTVIGQFAQAIIGEEIRNNQFVVRTDKPGVKVSWQVTGVRNDKYAQQHRIVDVVEKTGADKGKYLNPELYGRPASEGIGAAPDDKRPTDTAQPR